MKLTLLLNGIILLSLLLGINGCSPSKKMQKEVIETAVVGYINPQQLESVNGVVNFNYTTNFAPKEFDKHTVLKITPNIKHARSPFTSFFILIFFCSMNPSC